MTAPEQIWAVHHETQGAVMIGEWADTIRHLGGTEYRRADLPPTLSAALDLPQIKALVRASKEVKRSYWQDSDGVIRGMYDIEAALRAIEDAQ